MHICFLIHKEYPQNHATGMHEYTRILSALGVDVTAIVATTADDQPRRERINGVDVHRISTDDLGKKSLEPTIFAYRGLRKLDRLCRHKSIDVLHMPAFPGLGLLLRPIRWFDTPPAVIDIRSPATSNQTVEWISRVVLNVQAALVDTIITSTPLMAKGILGESDAAEIVPIGADFKQFRPGNSSKVRRSLGLTSEDIVFGYTGGLNQVRNIDQMIDAFALVNETHPQAKLVLVGDGDSREHLEQYTARSDCADAVSFTGEIPFADVPRYVRAFDVGFAHIPNRRPFSIHPPLKTTEFLASGLPVLATDTPGNRQFVQHNENGLLCPDSKSAYQIAMQEFIESPAERERLGANARDSIREYDYWHIVESDLLPVYEHTMELDEGQQTKASPSQR